MALPLLANLVCGSPHRNHDFDYARINLAQALYDAGGIRTDCFIDYENVDAWARCDMVVSYTSQVPVSEAASSVMRAFLERGGRWFALHASNSVGDNQIVPQIMGTRFITHPPFQRFRVDTARPEDPLLEGIAPFEIDDELYCVETVRDDIEVLLQCHWGGEAFGGRMMETKNWPLMYRRHVGEGGLLYLALGHANRPYDKPFADRPDQPDHRGPWQDPVFKTLIQRGVEWAARRRPFA
ncbi:type 1 glutamine amidotransferase [Sphingobium sp. B1D7B]|uniref:ThuA domain-containing protein n=1 Tax=unclassified Sphingobium TaxID=2611147 RepID=UPI00222467CD|nr:MULTISPECIES: ThuA domain-containing protein [unclassified Sphingobium]MCW2392780.1 type 1 glutamine amidotransferase [Sphingobium sp. B11D3A]MCW2404514.1 type 1 glutamine amidotransferase [Sphingobium sp. B1D7B]